MNFAPITLLRSALHNRGSFLLPALPAFIIAALFVIFLSSCKQHTAINLYSTNSVDSVNSISIANAWHFEELALKISNSAAASARFYITPASMDLYSDSVIVKNLLNGQMSPEQKCLILWKFVNEWTSSCKPVSQQDQQIHNPAILINGFECGFCDDRNSALANLASTAGIGSRVCGLHGHVVTELYYKQSWHLYDADHNIYYTQPNGQVASLDWLMAHLSVIAEQGDKRFSKLQPRFVNRHTQFLLSHSHYEVSGWYQFVRADYTSSIELRKGDELQMTLAPSAAQKSRCDRLEEKRGAIYKRSGVLTSAVDPDSPGLNDNACLFEQKLPYPMDEVSVTTGLNPDRKQVYKVLYSPDKLHWQYKGIISAYLKSLTFQLSDSNNIPYVFAYYLKLVPMFPGTTAQAPDFTVQSHFTFSDQVLLNNDEHAFRIVPLNEGAKHLSVKLSGLK